jgi:hypothetical protein
MPVSFSDLETFSAEAQRGALREWCEENLIELSD